jgi:heterotetrameric sarcosine oxidase gamma subunit
VRVVTASLRELDLDRQVDVRGEAPAGFPVTPNTTATVDGRLVLWLAPDEWLVVGGVEEDYPDALAVVDVSANRVAFRLTGAARAVLAQGCSLDLDVLPVGGCAQTLLARAEVLLHRSATDAFTIFVRPSFAPYLRAWLDDALLGVGSRR